jgi:hypothetical protein
MAGATWLQMFHVSRGLDQFRVDVTCREPATSQGGVNVALDAELMVLEEPDRGMRKSRSSVRNFIVFAVRLTWKLADLK